jgi:hypothetical protein
VSFVDPGVFTPYSTVRPLIGGGEDPVLWAPEIDRERIQAYQKYEEIYWSHTDAFRLVERGTEEDFPVYVPNPRTIVDTTAYFFLKGMSIQLHKSDTDQGTSPAQEELNRFIDRERFYSKFHEAKHSGVTRGDYLLHMTADPRKPETSRVSVNSLDPAMYFPEFDDDNLERVLAVNLVEQIIDPLDPSKTRVRWLRYSYGSSQFPGDPQMAFSDPERVVLSQEAIWEVDGWWKGDERKRVKVVRELQELPSPIRTIPVYHFKNIPWQGQPFGSSELRGYEIVQAGINQGVTDEGLALALEGLGVYATDSGPPVDKEGNETPWSISPARVLELSAGAIFKRVEGIASVKPWQDHIGFLVDSLYESTGTFRGGAIEAQVAQSGIALAIKFLPTQAKLQERDEHGSSVLKQWTFDWLDWMRAYESINLSAPSINVALEDKLPTNKTDMLNLLNNMMDRKAISRKYYREQLGSVYGLEFPDDIEQQIQDEAQEAMQAAIERAAALTEAGGGPNPTNSDGKPPPGTPEPNGNRSNNRNRPNESAGTEATQQPRQQTRV